MSEKPRSWRESGLASFLLIWLGRTVSLLGSAFTSFSIGIWVYQDTGSVTRFTATALCAVIPPIVISPFLGPVLDRWDRRWAMFAGDIGSALATLVLVGLFWTDQARLWHLCVLLAAIGAFSSVQFPAFSASITLLVPREQLGRANGLVQFGYSLATLVAPLASGALVQAIHIKGIVVIDFFSCCVAAATLLAVRIPKPPPGLAERTAPRRSFLADAAFGWSFIRSRPGLLSMLVLFFGFNLTNTMVESLITPLVLSFASPAVLGTVVSGAGTGMVLGGLLVMAWGGPRRRMPAILGFLALQGVMLAVGGFRPHAVQIGLAAFVYLFCTPVISSSSHVIWQSKVPPDIQGRVFAIRQMIASSALPLSYLLVGPLSDYCFEPLMAVNGPLAASAGRLLGTGAGRGIGLFLVVLGGVMLLVSLLAWQHSALRDVERELPDAVPNPT
ncbi:MAG TPA: MFS transporter [Thermoanaerobaculia bacterium]|jgi:MFS family permease|nr:MFS transporter [Thermoanaerobaculia bacterium]